MLWEDSFSNTIDESSFLEPLSLKVSMVRLAMAKSIAEPFYLSPYRTNST
jgi:hypothetical protein